MNTNNLHIQKININSVLGIEELEFEAGTFNVIQGRNGEGKTSVLEAIKSVLQDGHDATLLRKGAEKGEVVLVLNDGTELRKRISDKASPRTMHREGGKVPRPAEAIKALTDLMSVNPIDFLRAPKKDRVRVLLESMPLQVDLEKLAKLSGVPVYGDANDGLVLVDAVRKQVFDDRTGTNRAVKEKDATINQLRHALPDAPGGVDSTDEEALERQLEEAASVRDAENERIATKLGGIKDENRTKIDAIREETQRRIDEIKAEAAAKVEAIQAEERDIESKAGTQRERNMARYQEAIEPLRRNLNAIRENRDAAARRQQTLETIEGLEEQLAELQQDAEKQTQAIKDIDAYKGALLDSLPIPGLVVRDGEIYRDDVAFDRLNTAQQVDIAVELAKLRAGDLRICCVDGVELLDSAAFEEFRERAIESGLQLFVSRVSDGDFAVESAE